MSVFVEVPAPFPARARSFAGRMIDWYDSPEGRWSASRSRSGDRGTEENPDRLYQGKLGECALALYLGQDPETAVRWNVAQADVGWDIDQHGFLIDVKTTPMNYRFLLWSRDVNDLFESKVFHALCAVSADDQDPTSGRCRIDGYILKDTFRATKQVAGYGSPLQLGTWHVAKSALLPAEDLLRLAAVARRNAITWRYVQGLWP